MDNTLLTILSAFADEKSKGRDVAQSNKTFRETHPSLSDEKCTVKYVICPRIFGTRSTGGKKLAKSAIRLAIDTGLMDPVKFEKAQISALAQIKPIVKTDVSPKEAVMILNNFEEKFGAKCSNHFITEYKAYKKAKQDFIAKYHITVNNSGKPLIATEEIQKAYFREMSAYSFSFYEIYVSVKPDHGRATRSKCLRVMDKIEVDQFLSQLD